MKTTWIAMAIVAALSQWAMAAGTEPLSLREPTVVRITDKVLLKDVMRIGMNTGWESSPWDIPMWKLKWTPKFGPVAKLDFSGSAWNETKQNHEEHKTKTIHWSLQSESRIGSFAGP